jgi:hypothetical protein
MRRMYGVEMQAPAGKLPGFYAQVIHKIGDNVNVFDRDQQLLIVETEEERKKLTQILEKAQMLGDAFDLWLLPPGTDWPDPADYGFTSDNNHTYAYADQVSLFRMDAGLAEDSWAALQQMKDHILLSPTASDGSPIYLVDRNLEELMEGIARAYHVSIRWY